MTSRLEDELIFTPSRVVDLARGVFPMRGFTKFETETALEKK